MGTDRWSNVRDTARYNDLIHAREPAADFHEEVPAPMRGAESIAFGLRTNRGVATNDLLPWREQMAEFEALGLIQTAGSRVLLTRKGRLLADTVAEAFV